MKKFSVKHIVAIGIGAALFFVLGRFVSIPSPIPNTTITTQYGLLAFLTVVFGPIAGMLVGFIGHALVDLSFGWGIWWSWVITSGVFGLLLGLLSKAFKLHNGGSNKKTLISFNVLQTICHLICWVVIAPVLDILMYQEPVEKLFAQGLLCGITNAIITAIIGTLLLVAYSAAMPKAGSLKEEK